MNQYRTKFAIALIVLLIVTPLALMHGDLVASFINTSLGHVEEVIGNMANVEASYIASIFRG